MLWPGLAHAVYQHPSEALSLIAITGTNGKTTISQCVARVHPRPLRRDRHAGRWFSGGRWWKPVYHARGNGADALSGRCDAQAGACALEASSIGIEEGRLNGARVDVAVVHQPRC